MAFVVQKNHLRSSSDVYSLFKWLAHKCKNLYNSALYLIKTHFAQTGKYLSEKQLFQQIKSHITYKQLHSDNAQLTLRTLRQNFSSFFELLKLKKKGEYNENVNPPSYLHKDGYFVAQFISRQIKRVGNQLRLSLGKRGKESMGTRFLWVTLPPNILDKVVTMVRVIPKYDGHYLETEFVYDAQIHMAKLDYTQYLALDLGLDNFATAVSTKETGFIIEGRGIKSYNQGWNKQKAQLQSQYDKQRIDWGKKMFQQQIKRYNVMRNFISHTVHKIIEHSLKHQIGNLIIGDWEDIKRGLKMQKKTAQLFQQIPYGKFKSNLQSKAELYGIKVFLVDEAYTSQMCSGCGLIRKANRIKRGLYRCKACGLQLNADINAAINILRKVAPNSLAKWSSGDIISPKRLRLVNFSV